MALIKLILILVSLCNINVYSEDKKEYDFELDPALTVESLKDIENICKAYQLGIS